jgi:AAA family ATP:ADP antiporter
MEDNKNTAISFIQRYLQVDFYDVKKILLAGATFFFIIGSYSILRSLKTSIFLGFVGREYEPLAKILTILTTIPAMMFHGKIVDKFKRHQAVCVFLGIYAVLSLVFAYFFAHPIYGLHNTQTSPWRVIGWAFEIAMDLFQALIVGTFWSFMTSISTTTFATKGYGFIVACSRVGGILTPLIGWLVLEKSGFAHTTTIPFLTGITAFLLLGAIGCTYLIRHKIPAEYLYGYQAAHDAAKAQAKSKTKTGVFEGLKLMLTEPYVMGIFGLVFSFEVINIMFDYQMHVLMSIETSNHVGAMSSFMFFYTGSFQALSLVFALFGTSAMLKHFGVQRCLFVMPIVTMILAILPVLSPHLATLFIVMVILRALNYGFSHPIREILFIPTVKDIQFKSKAWLDSFGRTFSKTTGSTFNMIAITQSPYLCIALESAFSFGLAIVWAVIALFLGRKYIKTVEANSVIGQKATK